MQQFDLGEYTKEILKRETEKVVTDSLMKSSSGLKPWTPTIAQEFANVSIEDLIFDEYFLNLKKSIYPSIVDDILDLYEERKKRPIHYVFLNEAIGSGKSFFASVISWIEWSRFAFHFDPFKEFELASNSTVAQVFMSRTAHLAKEVMFKKVEPLFKCQFNLDYFPPSPRITSRIEIPRNRTVLFPGSGDAAAALGYDIWGAVVDESNFLERIKGSKKGSGSKEEILDQAEEMHSGLSSRRESRFGKFLDKSGFIIMISSSRYANDFLEKKVQELDNIKRNEGDAGVYKTKTFWRKRTFWEAKPKSWFPGYWKRNEKFFMNDQHYNVVKDTFEVEVFEVFLNLMKLVDKLNKQKGLGNGKRIIVDTTHSRTEESTSSEGSSVHAAEIFS